MEYIRNYPKVELHCHLDGSLPPSLIRELTGQPDLSKGVMTVSQDCKNLKEYLEKFELPLSVLQTEANLERAAEEFLLSLAGENVRYVEVRFAPLLCTAGNLSCEKVLEAVLKGLKKGRLKTGIQSSVIVCAMRNHSFEENFHVLLTAMEFYKSGVCAMDLAGDEASYPTGEFRELFRKAKNYRMPFTIHAGECGSPLDVEAAYEFGARRVGHGLALLKNPELLKTFVQKGIGVELCPTSNFQTRAAAGPDDYPLKQFYEAGLPVSINTDNRTVSGTDLSTELIKAVGMISPSAQEEWEESLELLEKLQKNAIDTAFAEDDIRQELWRQIKNF